MWQAVWSFFHQAFILRVVGRRRSCWRWSGRAEEMRENAASLKHRLPHSFTFLPWKLNLFFLPPPQWQPLKTLKISSSIYNSNEIIPLAISALFNWRGGNGICAPTFVASRRVIFFLSIHSCVSSKKHFWTREMSRIAFLKCWNVSSFTLLVCLSFIGTPFVYRFTLVNKAHIFTLKSTFLLTPCCVYTHICMFWTSRIEL